ncbi:hypothetical protein HJC23_005606 [Cyclotella cryptica]|uniref:Conserved oligomeric Golgi complex subunit 5 helical domain-containing protein n=1 Tax=Cyclotella cryptica TaxID=29204 RepID=A0ABD3PY59_9STRA|eukprot:CCRYP_010476-RA/>CCRYP_010476-RA protein AED:0.09 eAED:0.09 QI:148/0.66/0.75/1/0.33/0.25/4/1900/1105
MSTSTSTTNSVTSNAANALALLLREDPLLVQHGLTSYRGERSSTGKDSDESTQDEAAYAYAASLLHDNGDFSHGDPESSSGWMSSSGEYRQRASEALAEVDRKLALVDSLSQRISRDAPERVAGPLLRLHGFELDDDGKNNEKDRNRVVASTLTMTATREKAGRLHRQSTLLAQIASRVESTLQRGVTRMESSTTRLSRVLELSSTLKMIMRLQFEARKVCSDGVFMDWDSSAGIGGVDLRDLTRAAASVAVMEELLAHPALTPEDGAQTIDVVEKLRPGAEAVASSVRKAAAGLMNELQNHPSSSSSSLSRLGATLQVYFHLGELHDASWKAVASALSLAEKASSQLFHPAGVQKMKEAAKAEAKALAEEEANKKDSGMDSLSASSGNNPGLAKVDPRQRKKQTEVIYQRVYARKLREKRSALSSKWSTAVADAASRVWNLHRVLARRNDAVSRRNFLEVVAEQDVPEEFRAAEIWLEQRMVGSKTNFSLFSLFWVQMCIGLGGRIQRLLKYDGGSLESDVASLYPAVRAASLEMVTELYDVMQMGLSSLEDAAACFSSSGGSAPAAGVMGGSACLEESVFLGMSGLEEDDMVSRADEAAGGFFGGNSADVWTHDVDSGFGANASLDARAKSGGAAASPTSTLAVFTSAEWIALQGGKGQDGTMGLLPLQKSFLKESKKRLFAPLEFMFPEAVSVDGDGVAQKVLPTLPSRYDLAKLDTNIREELSLADPRTGGGDLSMSTMISETVVDMLHEFCHAARRAISEVGEDRVVDPRTGAASEATKHNLRVANVMSTLATFVRSAPENTFVTPYRPAQSPQHEEASHACSVALLPALQEMENLVKSSILNPLCCALNRRIGNAIAKMHRGIYLSETTDVSQASSFVQLHLTDQFDQVANAYLSQLPGDFASIVASTIATFSIYSFVSNAALVRPLGETSRLRLTQDLADFELVLEQFVFKGGASSLSQIADGKPYAELRAVRQLLYWNMLEDKTLSPAEIAKSLLREVWVKDFRPSTLFHFLFSFAPNLLSSPHHFKRMDAGEYVGTMVKLDGSIEDGEASAWMTCMACCDAYQQRESVDALIVEGDRRISAILMVIGPELLRRRRQ